MADIDLYAEAYRTSLGREASPEELQGWVSGQYGGGSVQDRINQITNSHEAQQRNPQPQPQAPTAPVIGQNPNVSTPMVPPPSGVDPTFSTDLGAAYQQYLGRAASPDEISSWWSGQYGYGSGLSGLGSFREAIRNSPESRTRAGGQAPPVSYQDTMYWNSQGVTNDQIFDTTTGQLRPGWQRTARGYERTGGAQSGGGGPFGSQPLPGDPRALFMQLTNGRPPSPQALAALEPQLNQYGIRLGPKNARGWSDTIIMPDGTVYDVIQGATDTGGQAWSWFVPTSGGVGGGQLPGNQYSDPYTQLLEQLIKSRLGMLQGGVSDPYRDQLMAAYQQRANALGAAAEPQYQALVNRLESRFQDLQGPGYTGAENETIRTGALDPIETDRAAARQRVIERLAARGITLESGIAQQALNEVDKAFDGMRATTQTTLTTNDLNRREDRAQRADSIKGTLYDIPQARAREQLDVFSAMEVLESVMRQEEEARSREAIGYGGVLADLGPQRMQLAMQAAGMGGNPQSMFNSLYQMMNMNQNAALLNQRNSGQLWSGLGSIAYSLMNAGR